MDLQILTGGALAVLVLDRAISLVRAARNGKVSASTPSNPLMNGGVNAKLDRIIDNGERQLTVLTDMRGELRNGRT